MTIALAVACEEGAVLISDSMTAKVENGQPVGFSLTGKGKRGLIPGFAYALSGRLHREDRLLPEPPASSSFTEGARHLYTCASQASPLSVARASRFDLNSDGSPITEDEMEYLGTYPQELIVCRAPFRSDEVPQIAWFDPKAEHEYDISEGAVIVLGSPRFWAVRNGIAASAAPTTLAQSEEMAVSIARRYIDEWYHGRSLQDLIFAERVLPPVAYPLHVFTISSVGVKDWQYLP